MNRHDILNNTHTTVIELINFIKTDIITDPNIQDDLEFIRNFFHIMVKRDLMNHLLNKVLPHENKIKSRHTDFFTSSKNRHIFSVIPEEKYAYFSETIKKGKVSQEDIGVIFDYFDTLVELCKIFKELD